MTVFLSHPRVLFVKLELRSEEMPLQPWSPISASGFSPVTDDEMIRHITARIRGVAP